MEMLLEMRNDENAIQDGTDVGSYKNNVDRLNKNQEDAC